MINNGGDKMKYKVSLNITKIVHAKDKEDALVKFWSQFDSYDVNSLRRVLVKKTVVREVKPKREPKFKRIII
jgi:CO dehydrogenase/acetyl-CoA synthase delta subunit